MQLRNLSPRTIASYAMRVAAFARHFGRSPQALGAEGVRAYLLHLVQDKQISWNDYNQTVAALKFVYEVTRFFASIIGLKHRTIIMTAYAGGLRISEVVSLRPDDIDSKRMVDHFRLGKGSKDRYVMLSPRLLDLLREY